MADSSNYKPVFSELAASAIVALPRRKARLVLHRCGTLAQNPFIAPDYVLRDETGREIEHLLVDGFILAYWVDHAVKQVFIVEIESAE